MRYNPNIHHRRSIRLSGYDYTRAGLYYITLCTHNRELIFGKIENGEMVLNEYGKIADKCLLSIPDHYPWAKLDQYVIMPNHIHFIIAIMTDTERIAAGIAPAIAVGANDHSPQQQSPPQSPPPGSNGTGIGVGANDHSPQQSPPIGSNGTGIGVRANDHSPQQSFHSPIRPGTSKTIGSVVRGFKIGVTKWCRKNTETHTIWQRNYYEHIIRDEKSYQQISEYIQKNPLNWKDDTYYE